MIHRAIHKGHILSMNGKDRDVCSAIQEREMTLINSNYSEDIPISFSLHIPFHGTIELKDDIGFFLLLIASML